MARSRASAAATAPAPTGKQGRGKQQPPSGDEHGVKDVRAALAALEGGWGDTEERSFTEIPPGKYQAKITEATINNAKSSGRLQVSWTLEVVNGEFTGRNLWCHDGIEDEEQRAFFRGKLARIGLEWPPKPTDLPDKLQEALDTYVEITVKQKGEFTNIYFNKALDSADILQVEETEPTPAPVTTGKRGRAAAAPEPEPEPEVTEASFVAGIDDDAMTPKQRKEIKDLAKKMDVDPDTYDELTSLMLDIAETLEIYGEFESPDALMTQIRAAAAA